MPVTNNICRKLEDGTIEISEWFSNGVLVTRRDAMPSYYPQSFYSCLERLEENPEDYGFHKDINHDILKNNWKL